LFLLKYEVTWKGYLKGNIRDINAKIVSDKLLIFLEKKIIFEANNICLNTSNCIWNWTLLWNFFKFISHKSNLLFSVLFKVFALLKIEEFTRKQTSYMIARYKETLDILVKFEKK
jgi:hypothetical protein